MQSDFFFIYYHLFSENFNVIYFGPKCGSDKSVPMIINPHGGPHSSYFNAFSVEAAMYASLGMY